jgi:hypothetical protein
MFSSPFIYNGALLSNPAAHPQSHPFVACAALPGRAGQGTHTASEMADPACSRYPLAHTGVAKLEHCAAVLRVDLNFPVIHAAQTLFRISNPGRQRQDGIPFEKQLLL